MKKIYVLDEEDIEQLEDCKTNLQEFLTEFTMPELMSKDKIKKVGEEVLSKITCVLKQCDCSKCGTGCEKCK